MKRPASVLDVRPDLFAVVCCYCDKPGGEGLAWAEARGYQVTHSYCPPHVRQHFPFAFETGEAKREGRVPVY